MEKKSIKLINVTFVLTFLNMRQNIRVSISLESARRAHSKEVSQV